MNFACKEENWKWPIQSIKIIKSKSYPFNLISLTQMTEDYQIFFSNYKMTGKIILKCLENNYAFNVIYPCVIMN